MINEQEFIRKYYSTANQPLKKWVEYLLETINSHTDSPLESALKDKKFLCDLFYAKNYINGMSRAHYQRTKCFLIHLFDYCGVSYAIPTRKEVMASRKVIFYFSGINELLKFIDDVGKESLFTYNPTRDFVRIKAICVLGWLGFTVEEIADIKKSDLKMIDNNGYEIKHDTETYRIFGAPFSALFFLSILQEYQAPPTGKLVYLRGDSEYLFRSTIPGKKLDGEQIIQTIKRFNKCIPKTTPIAIAFRHLHKNALFLDIYNDKSDKNLIDKIAAVMGCSTNYATSYKAQYLEFVKVMENIKL